MAQHHGDDRNLPRKQRNGSYGHNQGDSSMITSSMDDEDSKMVEDPKAVNAKKISMQTTLDSTMRNGRTEGRKSADKAMINKHFESIKMADDETVQMIEDKLNDTARLTREGYFKKADRRLGDDRMVDLSQNGN